jgi:hypothetical protein
MKKTLRPSGGHILDIDPLELADQFLSRAHNVHTRKGFPSRIGGRRVAYSGTGGNALHIMNFVLSDFNWWVFFKANTIIARQAATTADITYAGITAVANPYEWVSTLLNGFPCFTNGKDVPYYWDGVAANDAVPLPDWPVGTVAKGIGAFRFHLFAWNLEDAGGVFDNKFMWSSAAEPGTVPDSWTPLASNEAGSGFCPDTPGRIVCAEALGTQFMLYKPTSFYAVEYLGQQPDNIFTVRPINRSVGALSSHCVLEMGAHLVVGNDDIVLTDGINTRSIAENRIKTFLATQIDETNQLNAFVLRDVSKHEVWVCVPEAGNTFCTVAHIWDEKRDTWVTRDLNQVTHGITGFVADTAVDNTWDADSQFWDLDNNAWTESAINTRLRVVVGEPANAFVEDTNDLTTITSRLQKYDMGFDDDSQRKITRRVWVYGTGAGMNTLQVRLGSRNDVKDTTPIVWGSFRDIQSDGTPYEVEGRYISVETQQTGTDTYTVSKLIVEADYNGAY